MDYLEIKKHIKIDNKDLLKFMKESEIVRVTEIESPRLPEEDSICPFILSNII